MGKIVAGNEVWDPETSRTQVNALTTKQRLILDVICKGEGTTPEGRLIPIDLDRLLEALPYKTTKESMQFSIRALMCRGMIEKGERTMRRGRMRVVYLPTNLALSCTRFSRGSGLADLAEGETADPVLNDLTRIAGINPGAEVD